MKITKAASLADDLVRQFEAEILSGALNPGERFPTEMTITAEFGVSRTVVREAFARLAARGLLESRRGSGAYVAEGARYQAFQVTANELREIDDVLRLLEMRTGFEAEMASIAAQRRTQDDLDAMLDCMEQMARSTDTEASVAADTAFHAAIARATRNPYFLRFTDFLGIRLVPSRRLYLRTDSPRSHAAYAQTINKDHKAIYDAIAAQSPAKASQAARRHMEKSFERYSAIARVVAE
jgi:GntR family transcriptional regulator, transcriptional repressor for pyruvate dehydrogenase complex